MFSAAKSPLADGFCPPPLRLWVIIMSQMTLALYAGETAVAWVSRAQGTFFGCLVGMVSDVGGFPRGNI